MRRMISMTHRGIGFGLIVSSLLLTGCDSSERKETLEEKPDSPVQVQRNNKAEVLPYLNIQEQPAKIALPFCENKNCIHLDIQSLHTADPWINSWITAQLAQVLQDQIGLKEKLSLQQAVSSYVKKSDAWQRKNRRNEAFELSMYTRIPYQRNQFVLLQIGLDSNQGESKVQARYYFFVADRRGQKMLKMLDVIEPKQQKYLDSLLQKAYQDWLKQQDHAVKRAAAKTLSWEQANWFFDQEGLGFHYRSNEIIKDAKQLDIYLTKQQTQQVLKAEFYSDMF